MLHGRETGKETKVTRKTFQKKIKNSLRIIVLKNIKKEHLQPRNKIDCECTYNLATHSFLGVTFASQENQPNGESLG